MKTTRNITSNLTKPARLGLTLAGIITAVLCSLTFFQDVRGEKPTLPVLTSTQKRPQLISIDFTMEIKKMATVLMPL